MRLVSYRYRGDASYGIWTDGGIIDLKRRLGFPELRCALDNLSQIEEFIASEPDITGSVDLLPPIICPPKIVCVGLNFKSHIAETGSQIPDRPSLFSRYTDSIVGHLDHLIRPRVSSHFDFEGELAVIIGRPGRHVRREDALDHVAGYTVFNDGSVRDFQRHTTQFTPGKNFFRSGSAGPWLVTVDEAGPVESMELVTRLNTVVVQSARLDDLLFGVSDLISYISQIWPISPGDVIATGTPAGVGAARKPPLWLSPGDTLEVEISGVGCLRNTVEDEH